MGWKDLVADITEFTEKTEGSNVVSVKLDGDSVAISLKVVKDGQEKLLPLRLSYSNLDRYPQGGACLYREDSGDIPELLDESADKPTDFPEVIRTLCNHFSVLVPQLGEVATVRPAGIARHESLTSSVASTESATESEVLPELTPRTFSFNEDDWERAKNDVDEVKRFGYGADITDIGHKMQIQLSLDVQQLKLHKETAAAWRLDMDTKLVISVDFQASYPSLIATKDDRQDSSPETAALDIFAVKRDDTRSRWDKTDGLSFGLQWTLNDRLKNFFRLVKHQARYGLTESAAAELLLCEDQRQLRLPEAELATTLDDCRRRGQELDARNKRFLVGLPTDCEAERRNVLLRMVCFVHRAVLTCTRYCLICHKPVEYECCKPFVCTTQPRICEFKLMDPLINAAVDIFLEVQSSPEVVDLLISLAYAAFVGPAQRFGKLFPPLFESRIPGAGSVVVDEAEESRLRLRGVDTSFASFQPNLGDGKGACAAKAEKLYLVLDNGEQYLVTSILSDTSIEVAEPFLHDYTCKRYRLVRHFDVAALSADEGGRAMVDLLSMLPSLVEMRKCSDGSALRALLDERHWCAYAVLRWLICSCRTHIRRLGPDELIKGLPACLNQQFVMLSSAPEKEERFRTARRQARKQRSGTGSFHAWHGSALSNWHSILRVGLKNLSDTEHMTAGAGSGDHLRHYIEKVSG